MSDGHPAPSRFDDPVEVVSTRTADAARGPLLLQFREGKPEAIARASAVIGRVVRFRGYYIPADERPDVIQEALVDLLRAIRESRLATDEDFFSFIRIVSYRRCIDWMRRTGRRGRIDGRMMRELLPDDGLLDRERRNLAVEVVARLKKPCRELIALRIGRGLSYHQMSEVLGRTEAALRNQSYYCLKQARRILDRLRHRQQLVYLDRWRRG